MACRAEEYTSCKETDELGDPVGSIQLAQPNLSSPYSSNSLHPSHLNLPIISPIRRILESMIIGSAHFSRANLSVFRRARARTFGPAVDFDSVSQSGLGKSENNPRKIFLSHNWCKCHLTIL
jgi:hypothetical protein